MTKNTKDSNAPFLAIMNSDKTDLVAFVNPAKGYDLEDICTALVAKGLNAEVRVPNQEEKKAVL